MGRFENALLLLTTVVFAECQGLRYKSCSKNPAEDIVTINSLDLHPKPIQVPGSLSISASFTLTRPITGPLELDVLISRSFGGMIWIDLPCIKTSLGELGSCTYGDFCGVLKTLNGSCPWFLTQNNIPCTCPIPAKTYHMHQTTVSLQPNILGFTLPTVAGEYQASIRLTDRSTMKQLVCYDIDLEIVDPPSARPFGGIGRFLINLFG